MTKAKTTTAATPKKGKPTPKRPATPRVTAPAVTTTPATTIHVKQSDGLSPRQLDELRAATGWKTSDLFDIETGEPTGKVMAGRMWFAVRDVRPDLTPEFFYDHDLGAPIDGLEVVFEPEAGPTTAVG